MTARWTTACHWRLQMQKSCRAHTTTLPCPLAFFPRQRASLFFPEVHDEITKSTCFFLHPHFGRWRRIKRIRQPASPGWVSGHASLPAHGHCLEGKRSIASLVVLERHPWLNLTEMDADKVPFLDSPVSPTGLFGPAVEGFAERLTATPKSSQAIRHFLPKRSSSATALVAPRWRQEKATPPAVQPAPSPSPATHAWPDPPTEASGTPAQDSAEPSASGFFLSKGQEEEKANSRCSRTTPQKASVMPPSAPFSSGCGRQSVCEKYCCEHWVLCHRPSFMWHIVDIVLLARAVGKGSLPFHAQGLCSSYSSLTHSYRCTYLNCSRLCSERRW